MKRFMGRRPGRRQGVRLAVPFCALLASLALCFGAEAQTQAPAAPPASPPAAVTPPTTAPAKPAPEAAPTQITPGGTAAPKELAPGKPQDSEVEPNGAPGVPGNATTEDIDVPARPIIFLQGQSSYDEAFKSIKGSIETLRAAMAKAGLTPTGHPITIFGESNDKGSKYEVAVPIAAIPATKPDLGPGLSFGMSPAGKAIKFQHRGAYDDIDSTYDVITAYLDAKGLQVANSYIEEYLTDLTTADDPNLQVDVYIFVKP